MPFLHHSFLQILTQSHIHTQHSHTYKESPFYCFPQCYFEASRQLVYKVCQAIALPLPSEMGLATSRSSSGTFKQKMLFAAAHFGTVVLHPGCCIIKLSLMSKPGKGSQKCHNLNELAQTHKALAKKKKGVVVD